MVEVWSVAYCPNLAKNHPSFLRRNLRVSSTTKMSSARIGFKPVDGLWDGDLTSSKFLFVTLKNKHDHLQNRWSWALPIPPSPWAGTRTSRGPSTMITEPKSTGSPRNVWRTRRTLLRRESGTSISTGMRIGTRMRRRTRTRTWIRRVCRRLLVSLVYTDAPPPSPSSQRTVHDMYPRGGHSTVVNSNSWIENGHVLWIYQPSGVGYSYGKENDPNKDMVSKDVYFFL